MTGPRQGTAQEFLRLESAGRVDVAPLLPVSPQHTKQHVTVFKLISTWACTRGMALSWGFVGPTTRPVATPLCTFDTSALQQGHKDLLSCRAVLWVIKEA